jgi:hypothetical protein
MSTVRDRALLTLGSFAALTVGFVGARVLGGQDDTTATARSGTDLYSCPTEGALSIGQVHGGDRVWLIGVTGDRWAVIRHPEQPDVPAWMPLALVDTGADRGDLPELGCGDAVDTAGGLPITTAPPTSVGPTLPGGSTTSSTTSTTSSTTSTTIAVDTTPPVVTVTSNRPAFYTVSSGPPCNAEDDLEVAIVVDDPTLPLRIRSIVAEWTGQNGAHSVGLTPGVGNKVLVSVPAADGPAAGDTPLTITVTASDGVNNVGTGQLVVTLRKAPAACG